MMGFNLEVSIHTFQQNVNHGKKNAWNTRILLGPDTDAYRT